MIVDPKHSQGAVPDRLGLVGLPVIPMVVRLDGCALLSCRTKHGRHSNSAGDEHLQTDCLHVELNLCQGFVVASG